MILNPPIAGHAARVTATPISDDLTLVCVVHLSATVPFAEVYTVTRAGQTRLIGRSEPLGKDDSAAARAYADGTIRLFVSESDPGTGGVTAHITVYDFPSVVPATPPPATAIDTTARTLAQQAIDALNALKTTLRQV